MTSFGWKRKAGSSVLKETSKTFEANSKGDEDEALIAGDVDWLSLAPKKKCLVLEDAVAKSERLRQDGITLAEAERYWEALQKWDEALQFTPNNEKLHEMKAQVFMTLGEAYPAVCAAGKVVDTNPNWWIGHQTLGRAQLGLGEVTLALRSFSYAFHINPANMELRDEDLMWAAELVQRKTSLDREKLITAAAAETDTNVTVTDEDDVEATSPSDGDVSTAHDRNYFLPPNYVAMRD